MDAYCVATTILFVASAFCLLHPRIHTGIGGAFFGGVAVIAALAGSEQDPPRWATLLTASVAGSYLWYAYRQLRGAK